MLESLKADTRSALSTLRHRPVLFVTVVLTLAFGIAANVAVFSVVDAVLLEALPYPEPERIVTLSNRYGVERTASSPPDYMDRKRESRLLESIAAGASRPANLTLAGGARRVLTTRVTADFFRVMGVAPLFGSAALPGETSGRDVRMALVSFGFSQSVFGGGDQALGRTIRIDGESYLIEGVLPRELDFPAGTEVFLPLVFAPDQLAESFRGNEYLFEVGRMKPGVSLSELALEMNEVAASIVEQAPSRRRGFLARNGFGAEVRTFREHLVGESERPLLLLAAAVFLVLLVTAANVAHLLLASASSRLDELALRSSLGATSSRLFSQLLIESLLLSVAGGVLGFALSSLVVGALPGWLEGRLPGASAISVDGRAAAFTLGIALGTGALCGLGSARLAARASSRTPRGSPRSGPTAGARRLRSALVVSQVALALMLLIAAGLLVRSYERLSLREPGFEAEGRLRFGVDFPRTLYPSFEGRAAVVREILDRLRAIPGVRSAAASARTPLGGNPWTGTFHPEGFEPGSGAPVPGAELNVVSPDYPQALGMALLRGRGFTLDDDENALPVALVDRWTEERFWPEGATGQRIRVGGELHEVVGVVEHVLYETLDEPGRYQLYFPAFQRDWWRHLDFVIETHGDPASSAPRARAEIARLAPDLAVHSIRTLRGVVQDSLALRRLQTALVGIFGVVVLALASVGIYGVLSHSVGQRKKEIGLRMALGATRKAVLGLALKEGFVLAALGTAAGWIGARLVSRILPSLLYEVAATDLASYLAMTAILCSVILAAALIPAVRAARTDPWTALRSE